MRVDPHQVLLLKLALCFFSYGLLVPNIRVLNAVWISPFFFFWHYCPRWTLASSRIALHSSRSSYLHFQFLTPIFFRSSSTDSNRLNSGFPTRRVPSGFKNSKVSARIQLLHSQEVSQPPQSSYLYHFNYILFILDHIKLTMVSCSPYTIIVNKTVNHS